MDSLFSIKRCYLGANDFAPGIGVLVGRMSAQSAIQSAIL